jgi:hypothetical protein
MAMRITPVFVLVKAAPPQRERLQGGNRRRFRDGRQHGPSFRTFGLKRTFSGKIEGSSYRLREHADLLDPTGRLSCDIAR